MKKQIFALALIACLQTRANLPQEATAQPQQPTAQTSEKKPTLKEEFDTFKKENPHTVYIVASYLKYKSFSSAFIKDAWISIDENPDSNFYVLKTRITQQKNTPAEVQKEESVKTPLLKAAEEKNVGFATAFIDNNTTCEKISACNFDRYDYTSYIRKDLYKEIEKENSAPWWAFWR